VHSNNWGRDREACLALSCQARLVQVARVLATSTERDVFRMLDYEW
jgi:hypothetical protein